MIPSHLLQPTHNSDTKNWVHRDFSAQWSLVSVVLAGSTAQAAGWQVVPQHTMARVRWTLQQQSNGKGRVAARKRKGDRKKAQVKLPGRVIFSWQFLHILPYALLGYYDCTHHRAGPHQDSDWWPRPASAGSSICPGKQVFLPQHLCFYWSFTFSLTLKNWMESWTFFCSSFLPSACLSQHECLAGPSWSAWEEIEKETCRVPAWHMGTHISTRQDGERRKAGRSSPSPALKIYVHLQIVCCI